MNVHRRLLGRHHAGRAARPPGGDAARDWARSLTLMVAVLDIAHRRGLALGLFATAETIERRASAPARKGVLEGKDMARVFAWLRPNDLVWNYWVNNYLMGNTPPAFDILYWNNDTTRLPARLHGELLDIFSDEPAGAARRR